MVTACLRCETEGSVRVADGRGCWGWLFGVFLEAGASVIDAL